MIEWLNEWFRKILTLKVSTLNLTLIIYWLKLRLILQYAGLIFGILPNGFSRYLWSRSLFLQLDLQKAQQKAANSSSSSEEDSSAQQQQLQQQQQQLQQQQQQIQQQQQQLQQHQQQLQQQAQLLEERTRQLEERDKQLAQLQARTKQLEAEMAKKVGAYYIAYKRFSRNM